MINGSTQVKLDTLTQERLVNWGYAISDAALRAYVVGAAAAKPQLPYPDAPI
jgi:NTE family protein